MRVLLTLLITHQIRIVPFLAGGLTFKELAEMYPVLLPLRMDYLPSCDKLIPIIRRNLQKACKVIENPTLGILTEDKDIPPEPTDEEPITKNNQNKSHGIDEVNHENLAQIYRNLKDETYEIKQMAVTEIRNYIQKTNVWNFKEWWEILEFLIYSEKEEDRRDGLDILIEALKQSKREGGYTNIINTARELFGHKLLQYITPNNLKRISNDSMDILEVILDSDQVYDICIGGLIDGMKNIKGNEYTDYISKFRTRLENGNRGQLLKLLESIKNPR